MKRPIILFGIVLIAIGVLGYLLALTGLAGSTKASPTALIPAVIGLLVLASTRLGLVRGYLVSAILAVLGAAGVAPRLIKAFGGGISLALVSQLLTVVACVAFLVLFFKVRSKLKKLPGA